MTKEEEFFEYLLAERVELNREYRLHAVERFTRYLYVHHPEIPNPETVASELLGWSTLESYLRAIRNIHNRWLNRR